MFMDFQNLMKIEFCTRIMLSLAQNLGPIGSAILTFKGYKQTDKQISKEYINR